MWVPKNVTSSWYRKCAHLVSNSTQPWQGSVILRGKCSLWSFSSWTALPFETASRMNLPQSHYRWKIKLKQLILEYQTCFMAPNSKSGQTNLLQHEIITGNAKLVRQKLRMQPMHLQKEVDAELDKMLDADIIEPCEQPPWVMNLVCIQRKMGFCT